MRTVVIVGSHTRTRPDVPWDNLDADIWVFNESASIGWPKRVDGVLQMHAEPIWKNPLNRNDPKFPEWMRQEHPYPVWMLEDYDEVPAGVNYPLAEICREFLPGLHKGTAKVRYFTSSVAYAIALALYQGYERIELYGVEMESDTEYRLQRDGVFFWLGVALGRKVEVFIPTRANLFSDPLYGYEGGAYLGRPELAERKKLLIEKQAESAARLEAANQLQEQAIDRAMEESGGEPGLAAVATVRQYLASVKAQIEALVEAGMFAGAVAEVERYLIKCDQMDAESGTHLLARQEFELTAAQTDKVAEKRKTHLTTLGAEARTAWSALSEAVEHDAGQRRLDKLSENYAKSHQAYLTAAFEYGNANGVVQENIMLLKIVDDLIQAAGGSKAEEAILLDRMNARLSGKELVHV